MKKINNKAKPEELRTPEQIIEEMKKNHEETLKARKKELAKERRELKALERKTELDLFNQESLSLGKKILEETELKSVLEFTKRYDVVEKGTGSNLPENKSTFNFDEEQEKALEQFLKKKGEWCHREISKQDNKYQENSIVFQVAKLYEKLIKQL